MEQVLILDSPPLFKGFFAEKLKQAGIAVEFGNLAREGFSKLVSISPSLLILDASADLNDVMDFLEQKRANVSVAAIPILVMGESLDRDTIQKLPAFRVVKYFNKPVKYDIFFDTVGRLLRTSIPMDTTPCILEVHLNNNIIFVELAQALNREKISLLKYKISEIITENKLEHPKMVLMMTDLPLSFVDGSNLEFLLNTVISDPRIPPKNIKLLSFDPFTKALVAGHPEFKNIQVVDNLSSVLGSLVGDSHTGDITETISDKILTATADTNHGSVEIRFHTDTGVSDAPVPATNRKYRIAVVDDDAVVRRILTSTFEGANMQTDSYASGAEFLSQTNAIMYDLIILDIFMPGLSGFDILNTLKTKKYPAQIIIYSTATQRDSVVRALSLGAKVFMIKPQKSEALLNKAMELLRIQP